MGDQKQIKGLESMKHIVNSRINRLEYELKIAMEIEHSSKIVYKLEMLEYCKVIINVDLLRRTRKEENGISPFF